MIATLIDLTGSTIGTATIPDADGWPDFLQLAETNRLFASHGITGRYIDGIYEEASVSVVTLDEGR